MTDAVLRSTQGRIGILTVNNPPVNALAAGATEPGATVHLVDEGVDSGAVLRQEAVSVLPGDTPETLHARIRLIEHRLLPEVVRELIAA